MFVLFLLCPFPLPILFLYLHWMTCCAVVPLVIFSLPWTGLGALVPTVWLQTIMLIHQRLKGTSLCFCHLFCSPPLVSCSQPFLVFCSSLSFLNGPTLSLASLSLLYSNPWCSSLFQFAAPPSISCALTEWPSFEGATTFQNWQE